MQVEVERGAFFKQVISGKYEEDGSWQSYGARDG